MFERSFNFAPWIPPFTYDPHGTRIVDSQDHIILDVRGWGFLTGKGDAALGMNEEKACVIQDAVGFHVTAMLNASATASSKPKETTRNTLGES